VFGFLSTGLYAADAGLAVEPSEKKDSSFSSLVKCSLELELFLDLFCVAITWLVALLALSVFLL
jgi:hypothetical protein